MTIPKTTRIGLREAADLLGVHYTTMYRYVRTGRLPAERNGTTWSVAIADVERLRGPQISAQGTGAARQNRPRRLLDRMTASDEPGAWAIIEEALTAGCTASEIHVDLMIPTLRTIGDQWAAGKISVAAEHRASGIATRIVGRLGPMFEKRGPSRGTVVLGAPEGELHALPSAIVADLLRGRGFAVHDLGANTPAVSFVESARGARRLIAVLAGVTARDSIAELAVVASALRKGAIKAPIYFGGGALPSADAATRLGADGWSGVEVFGVISAVEHVALSPRRTKR